MHGTVKMALELWNAMTFHHFNLSPMVVCAKRSGTIACFSCNGVVIFVNSKKVDREPKCCCCCCWCCCCMMMRWWRRGGGSSKKKALLLLVVVVYTLIVECRNIWKVHLFYIKHWNCRVYFVIETAKNYWKNESGQKCGKTTFISGKVFCRFLFVLFLKRKTEDQIR